GSTVANKVYDGLTTASLTGGSLIGIVGSDTVTLTQVGSFVDKNAGTARAVTAADTLGGTDAGNYSVTQPTGLSADITPKALTVTGTTVANKVYDGLTTASLTGGSLIGIVGSDTVTLTQVGSFVDKNVGTAKAVTAADTLGGSDAGNYSVTQPTGLTANITPKALTVTGTTVANKVYDGLTAASLSGGSLVGIVGADTVTLTQAGSFVDKNAGTARAVTAADTLGGTDAGNYSVTQPTGLSADITPKALTVTGTTVANKVYDGLTTASLSGGSLIGIVGSDTVTLTQVGSFVDKNAGTARAVTAADTLGGSDAGNYSVTQPTGLTANITPKALTVTGTTVANKVYDGLTAASLSGGSLVGIVGADTVTLTQTGSFADKNVGTAKAVAAADALGGTDAGNYSLTQPTGLSADITPKALSMQGLQGQDKVYDGTLAATVSQQGLQWVGLVPGDQVLLGSVSGSFVDKNAGSGKTITLNTTLDGADLGNYTVTPQASTTANITQRSLTVTADNQAKTYGAADPTLTYQLGGQGLVAGDTAAGSLTGQLATDTGAAATAGSHAITLGTLSTNANYQITQFVPATLAVGKAALTITLDAQTKVYGAAEPPVTWSVDATLLKYADTAGVVQLTGSSMPGGAQATAGTHVITGQASAANYVVSVTNGVLTVTKAPLTVTADNKVKTTGEQDPALTWSVDASQLRYQDTAAVVQNATLTAPTGAGVAPGSYPIQITGATAQNYQLTLVDGVLTVKPSPAVKSENLESQIVDVPRTTLPYVSVTQPVVNAPPPPPMADLPMGPPGSVTVLGAGVGGEIGAGGSVGPVIGGLVSSPTPTPASSPVQPDASDDPLKSTPVTQPSAQPLFSNPSVPDIATGVRAQLVVVLPLLQVQGSELRTGLAASRLFSPPAGVKVTYSAKRDNGQPLPSWLRFDPDTGRLEGTPPPGVDDVTVQINAQTSDGQSATARIRVNGSRRRQ
ncbi:YDG domain-containing protein, partial [Roseateles cellulosilyticus]